MCAVQVSCLPLRFRSGSLRLAPSTPLGWWPTAKYTLGALERGMGAEPGNFPAGRAGGRLSTSLAALVGDSGSSGKLASESGR